MDGGVTDGPRLRYRLGPLSALRHDLFNCELVPCPLISHLGSRTLSTHAPAHSRFTQSCSAPFLLYVGKKTPGGSRDEQF